MAEKTAIQWADSTLNPWMGCAKISPACDHCYAERFGKRMGIEWGPNAQRRRTSASTWRQPLRWNRKAEIAFHAWEKFKTSYIGLTDADLEEQGFVKPRRPRVFCGSLCDVFDNAVPMEWRADLFKLIEDTPHLCWLLLTKRVGNVRDMAPVSWLGGPIQHGPDPSNIHGGWPENVWLGATICNQEEADRDIPKLLSVPAAKRFLSIEPCLGAIDLASQQIMIGDGRPFFNPLTGIEERSGMARNERISWVICGGETGPRARPMNPSWVRSLRDQCQAAGVPFFFKQWGEWHPNCLCDTKEPHPTTPRPEPGEPGVMFRCGKEAGRLLDNRLWDEVPA